MRASSLIVTILLLASTLRAQEDTAGTMLADYLREAGSPSATAERARGYLYQRFDARDPAGVRALLQVMAGHPEWRGWATGREILLARVYAIEPLVTRDSALEAMLAAAPLERGRRQDDLIAIEGAVIRTGLDALSQRYLRAGFTETEYRFLNLLVDHLLVNGYRARTELNRDVDRFTEAYPESPLAGIAERRIRYPYQEERFGVAFGVGYVLGRFAGPIADRFSYLHGPFLNGELYIDRTTLVGTLGFGAARLSRAFVAGADAWSRGNAPFVHASLLGGYELRTGRLALTPLGGIALESIRSPGETTFGQSLPSTGARIGLELGALVTYRIPFDLGTHIDLRARLGWTATGTGGYDPGFGGSSYVAGFGFALVHRPYLSIW